MSQTIFELAWKLCGMEKLMTGFYTHPQLVEGLFDRITNLRIIMARRFVEAGVNVLRLGDDAGSQKGMLLSPKIWRRFLKPRFAKIIEEARKVREDIPIFYHSDGDIREIIPELIEIGVTILNPVQAECMDPVEIKRKYGNRLALWGTIGTQTTIPFGTPEDVSLSVAQMCREMGKEAGFIISPTHSINEDVPWENIVAFYEAVEEFGAYQGGGKQ
jgi:uroporphyrinogen decarboxylase